MITLEKKKPINLTKAAPALSNVRIGLSWDETQINGQSPDCDSSAFLLAENGKIPNEGSFIFYNNLVSTDGSVRHNGDNRTGAGDGDDETLDVNLNQVAQSVVQILFVITIHNMEAGFNFGNITNPSVRVYDMAANKVLCQYQLSEAFPTCDALIIGRLFRSGNEWEFEAMGQAFSGGLGAAVELYS